ncbi:hypothetical protein KGF57_001787 [Candida theae]|uniref:Uncharacterized protein n=1 Tax=Candida theae TaxID=1198502 RepID=A0AAD5BGZ8_9ASCO|nr:uncharacterized protein KGF57_001787 [Candida theae]KAI5961285.1 hypothetical protein KGF57_001787 [Candida theae]
MITIDKLELLDTGTQIYLLTVFILSPVSVYFLYKQHKGSWRKKHEWATNFVAICIIILNINAWYFLIWSLKQHGDRLDRSSLHKELLKMNFEPIKVSGFTFDGERQHLLATLPQDSHSDMESNQQHDQSNAVEEKPANDQSNTQEEKSAKEKSAKEKSAKEQGKSGRRDTAESFNADGSFDCNTILVRDETSIAASKSYDLNQESDLKLLRDQLQVLSKNKDAYKLYFQDDPSQSEEYILRKKWFKFCGSAVWMDQYKVYFMVNRIVYAKDERRNNPTISVLSGQVFDKNWREIKGFKFPHSDLVFPTILPHDVDLGTREEKVVIGSEDPRIILNEYRNSDGDLMQEPLIIFNARRTKVKWARAMNIYRPFNDPQEVICLGIKDKKRSFIEKNWAPFIDHFNGENDGNSINFIYNFNPLRIIKCSLQTGECVKVSGPRFNPIDANDNAGVLRGGTNIIPIPDEFLPDTEVTRNRKYWLGIARSHNNDCGCMRELYRPHLFLMARLLTKEDSFELVYVSSMVDFNINPEPWSKGHSSKGTCRDGKSVLIPNSIAYWDVDYRDDADYLGVTFSEADRTNKLVHVKGILKHIHKVLHDSKKREVKDAGVGESAEPAERGAGRKTGEIELCNKLLGFCSTYLAGEYCEVAEKMFAW